MQALQTSYLGATLSTACNRIGTISQFFDCEGPQVKSQDEEFLGLRSQLLNGIRTKALYDCKHGLMGLFLHEQDDVSKAITVVDCADE
jgi:hypothetical protein